MEREEHQQEVTAFFKDNCDRYPVPELKSELHEALYAMSELGLWPDSVDTVSEDQAFLCWQIIETLRRDKFPEELNM